MLDPSLRIILDGDTSRPYREGQHVTGRVSLVLDHGEKVEGLKLSFLGACDTKTTRPFYIAGSEADRASTRREYAEYITLFHQEKDLLPACSLAANKHSWNFDFTFPYKTEPQFSRWAHGKKYTREPHPLPPTFQAPTNIPGGRATISYSLEAKLSLHSSKRAIKAFEKLKYMPNQRRTPREVQITSRILYGQTWKPSKKDTRTSVAKLLTKVSRKPSLSRPNTPQIVPTIYFPERISPGQHIPLLLCLARANIGAHPECILDSMTVTISTYTTSICGTPLSQPEDSTVKHVTCISKQNMQIPLSFSTPTPLTSNFRLIDDAECLPSFRTYSITRRYSMAVFLAIQSQDQKFPVHFTTPLEIVARAPHSGQRQTSEGEEADIEPLPLYVPRESGELAPDYETLYSAELSLSQALSLAPGSSPSSMPSSTSSSVLWAEAEGGTRSGSVVTGASVPVTPGEERDAPVGFGLEGPGFKAQCGGLGV